jgi:predicted double-glycine peptidase
MVKMLTFPKYRQSFEFDCGATATQSVLAYYGIDVNEGEVIKLAGTNETGTMPAGISAAIKHFGLEQKSGAMKMEEVKKYLDQNIPVVLVLQAWASHLVVDWANHWKSGHYVVAIGYDEEKVYFEDPASSHRTFLTFEKLEERWHDVDTAGNKYDHWGMAIFGKVPSYNPEAMLALE